jgi:hypothetical protein
MSACWNEQATNLLKGAAIRRKQWICYLGTEADVRLAIEYVERNALKDGLNRRRWSFVIQYES